MKSEIWRYGRGYFKAFTEEIDIAKRIMRWSSVERCSIYYTASMRIFAFDFVFASRTYDRIAKSLGLPERKKSSGRVNSGVRLQKASRIDQVKSSELPSAEV